MSDIFNSLIDVGMALVDCFLQQASAPATLAVESIKGLASVRDAWFVSKVKKFYDSLHEHSEEAIKFSQELFGGSRKEAEQNALRLIEYIGKTERDKTIEYIVSLSRALGIGLISEEDYFRILRTLVTTLPEDLEYFKTIALSHDRFTGDVQILSLAQNGLMITGGINANRSVEEQEYLVTTFGRMVDKYALSFENEGRYEEHKKHDDDGPQKFRDPSQEWGEF